MFAAVALALPALAVLGLGVTVLIPKWRRERRIRCGRRAFRQYCRDNRRWNDTVDPKGSVRYRR